VSINYVGHAERWDEIVIDGDITAKDLRAEIQAQGSATRSRFDIPRFRKPAG
jgi:hypothetical protein